MLVRRIKRRRQWFWLVLLVSGLLITTAIFFVTVYGNKNNQLPKDEVIVQPPQPTKITSKLLFFGNTFWGRYINDWSMASPLGYAYPFSRLSEFGREDYNAWISGIECPIVAGVNPTSAEQEAELQFNCRPEYLDEAAKWFSIFSLANNHTDNQGGPVGFKETQEQLESVGIQYFGHYDPRSTNDVCEVIGLPVTVSLDDGSIMEGRLPVAMCGHHGVFRIPDQASLEVMKQYSRYMPVIAMPHMGAEYKPSPDEIKTNFYRSLIDNGADMVLGDHPHWIQNSESYNGHLIVYSMGNFMFDQQGASEYTRSAAIDVDIKIDGIEPRVLETWLEIGEKCVRFKDDCLSEIDNKNLIRLPFEYQFSIIGTDNEDKLVKPATDEQLDSILKRLDWQNTIQKLEDPFSGV